MSGYNSKKRRVGRNYSDKEVDSDGSYADPFIGRFNPDLPHGSLNPNVPINNEPIITQPSDKGRLTGLPAGNYGSTAYSDLLRYFSQNGNSQVLDLLSQLGIKGLGAMSDTQSADWNKQLLDQMISQMSEEDKRRYNEERWNIQNIYDSPLNQLARLMGAGIGRDAAIQMLSGSGSGGGSTITGDAAALAGGLAPSESNKNAVDAATGIANTVFNGISSLVGLTSLGFSIPQALQSIKGLQMQNHLTSDMLQGLQAADALLGAAGSAVQTGLMSKEEYDKLTNGTDYLNHIATNKDKAGFAEIYSSPAFQRVYGTVQGREMFNRGWSAVTKSKTEGQQVANFVRSQELQNEVTRISADKMGVEMATIGKQGDFFDAQTNKALQDIAESQARVQIFDKQGKLLDIDYKTAKLDYDLYESGFPALKESYVKELGFQAKCWAALYQPDSEGKNTALDEAVDAWLKEKSSNAYLLAYCKEMDNKARAGFKDAAPALNAAIEVMKMCGILNRVYDGIENYDSPLLTPREKKGMIADIFK